MTAEPVEETRALGEVQSAFQDFFTARASKKDSENTRAAYARDLQSVLREVPRVLDAARTPFDDTTQTEVADVTLAHIRDLKTMRRAFAAWSEPRSHATVRRCHSTWSEFFKFLVSEDLIDGSPMPGIYRPPAPAKTPRAFEEDDEKRIITAVLEQAVTRRDPWPELDAAAVFTTLLTAVRLAELIGADVGDITPTEGKERIRVRGKGRKERVVPIERIGIEILEDYLRTRRARFPQHCRTRGVPEDAPIWRWFPSTAPLFVGRDGERMTRDALQYLVKLVYRAAGVESTRARGALVHALRHTTATRLAEQGVTGIELMTMLGHASLQTTQGYLHATGAAIRSAASKNSAYQQLEAARERPPDPADEPQT